MLDILCKLNEGKDRSVLIGRNALNFHFNGFEMGRKPSFFATTDFDVLCPDVNAANECRAILETAGFVKNGATFTAPDHPEMATIDIVIADPQFPANTVVEGFFNLPKESRVLWETRENTNGINVPNVYGLLMDKLLFLRQNDGHDAETIEIYFTLHPERLDPFIEKISAIADTRQRDRILYALYEGVAKNDSIKQKVEQAIVKDFQSQTDSQRDTVSRPTE